MKSITITRGEMKYAKQIGFTPTELVARKFKYDHNLYFNFYEVRAWSRFIYEEFADGSGYKITYLESEIPPNFI
jgi:hypothetical protein